jgi:hypothetical protein
MAHPGRPHPRHHPHGISDLERGSSVTNVARLPALGRDSISAKPLLGNVSPCSPWGRPGRIGDLTCTIVTAPVLADPVYGTMAWWMPMWR